MIGDGGVVGPALSPCCGGNDLNRLSLGSHSCVKPCYGELSLRGCAVLFN